MGNRIPSSIVEARNRYEKKVMGHGKSQQGSLIQMPFSTSLQDDITNRLKDYNSRDIENVKAHLDTIKQAISSEVEGTLEMRFGGSVAKRTFVNGLSDNDLLVFLNKSELVGKSPKEVQEHFKKYLEERLPKSEVTVGKLAVNVKFKSDGVEVQLLPAVKTATGMRIADPKTGRWSNVVKPHKFAAELTNVNQQNNGKVVPVIKLVKPILASLPKKLRISSYHIEALATEIFKTYNGPKTEEKMLNHFFKQATLRIRYPVKDGSGQSEYVDDKLGKRDSKRRMAISKVFENLDYRMENASDRKSMKRWKDILDGKSE